MWFSPHPEVGQPNRAGSDYPQSSRTRSGASPSGVVAWTACRGLSGRVPVAAHDCGRTGERHADGLLPLAGSEFTRAIPSFTACRFSTRTHCNPDYPWETLRRAGTRDRVSDLTDNQRNTQGRENR